MPRTPKLNWTPCYDQYTCTIGGVFHRLRKDEEAAEAQFKFLLRQLAPPQGESRGKDAVWTPEVFVQVLQVSNPAFADLVRILAWTGARPSTVIRIEARHYNKRQSRWDCEDLYRGRGNKKYVKHVR